tara:strand:- start:910 stop:1329 length:420 start_codon:yes stop_codon:yes gene_type:complete
MGRKYTPRQYKAMLKRLETSIIKDSGKSVNKTAAWGALKARQLAPYASGALHNAIRWKGTKTQQAWILQKNPGLQNPNNQGRPFNYAEAMRRNNNMGVRILHSRIRSGDPDYMRHAAQLARKKFLKDVRAHIVNAIRVK